MFVFLLIIEPVLINGVRIASLLGRLCIVPYATEQSVFSMKNLNRKSCCYTKIDKEINEHKKQPPHKIPEVVVHADSSITTTKKLGFWTSNACYLST